MAGRVALTLRCPENATPGAKVAVPLPGGGEHEVPVPEDAVPGEDFQVLASSLPFRWYAHPCLPGALPTPGERPQLPTIMNCHIAVVRGRREGSEAGRADNK